MSRIVIPMARTVVTIGKHGQVVFRVSCRDLGPRTHVVESLLACIQMQIHRLFFDAAYTFRARVAAAGFWVAFILEFILVLLVTAVALGMVGL